MVKNALKHAAIGILYIYMYMSQESISSVSPCITNRLTNNFILDSRQQANRLEP